MKDKVVIEDVDLVNHIKNSFDSKAKLEQEPETWEELKELCVKEFQLNTSKNINNDRRYIVCCAMNFYENGFIEDSEGIIIAQRTPQQMWQIIKSLVEEL